MQMKHLVIDPSQIIFKEDEIELQENLNGKKTYIEEISRKVEMDQVLRKQEDEVNMLSKDTEKTRVHVCLEVGKLRTAKIRVRRGRRVSLEQLLRMKFQAETVSCLFQVLLQDFISCPAITAAVQEEGDIFFCFKDDMSLDQG